MTMREVAAAAGVSLKTVSRVFNNDPHVRDETRARVKEALAAERYFPNTLSTSFRAGHADVIGLAVPDITDPFFASLVKAANELATSRGVSTIVTDLGTDPTREAELVLSLLRHQIFGLVIAPSSSDQSYLQNVLDRTPVVFVDRPPTGVQADSFSDDNYGGAYLATRHLIDGGHRRIAFIGETPELSTSRERLSGYQRALSEARIPIDSSLIARSVVDRSSADDAIRAFLAHGPIDALFSCSPRCSMVVVPALQAHTFAAVGYGDFPLSDLIQPSFSAIDQDPEQLARLAVQRLFDRRDNSTDREPERRVLEPRLIERSSSRDRRRITL